VALTAVENGKGLVDVDGILNLESSIIVLLPVPPCVNLYNTLLPSENVPVGFGRVYVALTVKFFISVENVSNFAFSGIKFVIVTESGNNNVEKLLILIYPPSV
jgi:hypothetical protein